MAYPFLFIERIDMAKNYVQAGTTIEFVAAAAIKSGAIIEVGSMVVVAQTDAKSGEVCVGHTQGVFLLSKVSGAIVQGETLYLKNGSIGKDNTGVYAGKAWQAAGADAAEVEVNLNFGTA